jgi:carotenoid 1,2-hydratase
MPELPLFTASALPDAGHAVRAPGGYEWWYFDAEDGSTDTQIVAIYLHGFIFHPGYLRAYAKYVRRPTKTLPPLPDDFACMYLVVYRGGRILTQIMTQVPASAYAAATDAVNVRVGPSTLTNDAGTLRLHVEGRPWELTWQGPVTAERGRVTADLTFAPTLPHAAHERRFFSRAMTGAEHHWVLANPHCGVSGRVRVTDESTGADETIAFAGVGYHDHNYGTAPIGPGLARWFWGRALLADRVVTFHVAVPRAGPAESHLVIAGPEGVEEAAVPPVIAYDRRTSLGLAYPSRAEWPGVLTLTAPRVIDASPFYLRLQYKADAGGVSTTAFTELAYPHRLRWPVLGRMIEMSIDKQAATS